jgi:hypothetical protein
LPHQVATLYFPCAGLALSSLRFNGTSCLLLLKYLFCPASLKDAVLALTSQQCEFHSFI